MQSVVKKLLILIPAVVGLVSCQSGVDMRRAYATSPDAVVSINQVDPAYRAYFRAQHGSDFSVAEQRKAFAAAVATASTPVPRYMPASVANPPRKTARRTRYLAKRNTKYSRGSSSSRRSVAKKGKSSSNKRLARNTRKRRR